MIAYIRRWLRREPVTFTEDNMLRVRMTARAHVPRAERFKIKNPRFYILTQRRRRARA